MRVAATAIALLALPVGATVERASDPPLPWLDLAAGLAVAAAGWLVARAGRPLPGVLLATSAHVWFAGTAVSDLAYAHRAALVLVIVVGSRRAGAFRTWLTVAVGAVAAVPWDRPQPAALALAAALVAASPRAAAAWLLALACAWAAVAPSLGLASDLVLGAYDVAIAAVGAAAAWAVLAARRRLAGRVVELGATGGAGAIERALREALGDPGLRLGLLDAASGTFRRENGDRVPAAGATEIPGVGPALAVLAHAPGGTIDRSVVAAVAAAVRLVAEHGGLVAAVEADAAALEASRRRLVDTAARERGRLAQRLAAGPARRLAALEDDVADVPQAAGLLAGARHDLARIGAGLLPEAVARGDLPAALRELAAICPLPVALDVRCSTLPLPVASAAYFVCAEAMTNAARHAGARSLRVTAATGAAGELVLAIADDGGGGADPDGGGLRGLADRVEAVGGRLTVTSGAGGTTVEALLPPGAR